MNWQLRRELLTNVAAVMGGGLQAALNLDFTTLTPSTLTTAGVTFSRASLATQYDSTGKLTYAPHNLTSSSEAIAGYFTSNMTNTGDTATDPNGGSTADTLTPTSTNGIHRTYETITPATAITLHSCYVKANGYTRVSLRENATTGAYAVFTLSGSGSVFTSGSAGGCTTSNPAITALANSWYRISVKFTFATPTNVGFGIYVLDNGYASGDPDAYSFAGDTTSGIYAWGAQVENVTYETAARTYVRTAGSAVYDGPRFDYNPSTLAAKGLLIEEARTNILKDSGDPSSGNWTDQEVTAVTNATTAPDGTTTAGSFKESTNNAQHQVKQAQTLSAASHTASVYVKAISRQYITIYPQGAGVAAYATFDITNGTVSGTGAAQYLSSAIQDVGSGWYRCQLTFTAAAVSVNTVIYISNDGTAAPTYAGDAAKGFYIWGAQVEAGSFVTSYIPTTSASATRAADLASMTSTNFSNWFNSSAGTFYAQGDMGGATDYLFAVSDNSSNNRLLIYQGTGVDLVATSGGVLQVNSMTTFPGYRTTFKTAAAFALNDFSIVTNGGSPATDSSATLPVGLDRIYLGASEIGSTLFLNGHIGRLTFYASRLPDATLQSLTT